MGCTNCHSSGNTIDPEEIGDAGTAGKHDTQAAVKGYPCEACREAYASQATHTKYHVIP